MSTARDEIDKADVKRWLQQDVSAEIEDLRDTEITAEHTQDSYRGVLAWFAKYYVDDDPDQLIFADGPGDGGIDIAAVRSSDTETHVDVFQVSAPKIESIGQGRLVLAKAKFGGDVRELRNTIIGKSKKIRKLNATAQEVLRQVNRARELAAAPEEGAAPITIAIHPLSLRHAHPDARREIDETSDEAAGQWSSAMERWIVHPLKDVLDLYRLYQKKRPQDQSPPELRLGVFGALSSDRPERGPFLAFLKASDVADAYRKWGAGLLDANLRFALGKTPVNKLIEQELSHVSSIKWFHEKNNGLVIVCNKCHQSKGHVRLFAPQIVNGGQTVHSITAVLDELESIPLEKRTGEEKARLQELEENLRLSARIVTISGGAVQKPDEIAIASNTQNKLSERTMRSASIEMRDLRLSFAALENPWFVVTKDGEWAAVSRQTRLFQSKTGNKRPKDFRREGRYCLVDNTDLGVAWLAFLGFVGEAKPSRVFKKNYFSTLYGYRPRDDVWASLASKRVEWRGSAFSDSFGVGQAGAPQWLLAHFVWLYWKSYTFPESRQLLMAYAEAGERDEAFKERYLKPSGWDVSDEAKAALLKKSDSCYWVEQVTKSAYLVLVYQTMRVLVRALGNLDNDTCLRILELPQFSDLYRGMLIGKIGDFREGSLTDGPLTALGRILHYACEMLWQGNEDRIRAMASRQQVFLQEEWIGRLSDQVDKVCERIGQPAFRHASELEGPGDADEEISGLNDLVG